MHIGRFKKQEKKTILLPILIPVMNLFLILLPFVLETSLLQQLTTHEITLPSLKPLEENKLMSTKEIILNINNSYVLLTYDDKVTKINIDNGFQINLENELMRLKMNSPELNSIQIKVDDNVSYQSLIDVLDICKKKNVGFEEIVYIDEVD